MEQMVRRVNREIQDFKELLDRKVNQDRKDNRDAIEKGRKG